MSASALSIVVIGRNEGARLRRCLAAALAMDLPGSKPEVIYVDSGSSDDSLAIAASLGVRSARLDTASPSASAARRRGLELTKAPFVLFLDGDTQVDPGFARAALAEMKDGRTAVVWGRLWELRPETSAYVRVHALEWNTTPGPTRSCGGNALHRRKALEAVGAFDPEVFAGEEADLCRRLRAAGWTILHIDAPMAGHDLDLRTFSQYWRRCLRTGYSYARLSDLTRNDQEPLGRREVRHNLLVATKLAVLALASLGLAAHFGSAWPMMLLPLGLTAAVAAAALRHRHQAKAAS